MTRWMIGMAMLGALTGAAYGQADAPAPAPQPGQPAQPAPVPPPPPPPAVGAARPVVVAPGVPATPAVPGMIQFQTMPPKLEKVTYLGAVTSAAPAAMRDQLKLAPGTGLVVDRVESGAPAEKAGLKQHDIIERLDDQLLINPQQLATLLRSKRPGDEVALAIVRQGERRSVKSKLDEKEVDANAYGMTGGGGGGDFQPMQLMLDGNAVSRIEAGAAPAPGRIPVETNWAFGGTPGKRVVTGRLLNDGTQTTVWADDEVSISIERRGGKTANMVIKDKKTDKPLYTGTGDGLEKLLDARPELKEKVKKAQDAANRDATRMQFTPGPKGAVGAMGGFGGGGGFGGIGTAMAGGGAGGKVVRWQDDDHVLLIRMSGRTPTYLLALSKKDGRTVFDGPVVNEDDRHGLPAEIAEQFQMVCAQPELAQELGGMTKPGPDAMPRTR